MTLVNGTLLTISGDGIPPYAARGLQQTLEPIALQNALRRTVNGKLVSLARTDFRRYRTTITGTDTNAPVLSGIWIGSRITIGCVAELCYLTATGSPERPVAGDTSGDGSRTEGSWTFYRPELTMLVTGWRTLTDEYGAAVGWQLDAEEEDY
jgi:hypothetical protein